MAVVYSIKYTDENKPSFIINPAEIDGITGNSSNSSLILHGNGRLQYGEALNENFLHLLENFASPARVMPLSLSIQVADNSGIPGTHFVQIFSNKTNIFINGFQFNITNSTGAINDGVYTTVSSSYDQLSNLTTIVLTESFPDDSVSIVGDVSYSIVEPEPEMLNPPYNEGQLWFNKTTGILYIYRDVTGSGNLQWDFASKVNFQTTQPQFPQTGDLWYDPVEEQLKIYVNGSFISVADRYVLKSGDEITPGSASTGIGATDGVLRFNNIGSNNVLFLNEGHGDSTIAPDIRANEDMLQTSEIDFIINFDNDNNSTGQFIIGKGSNNNTTNTKILTIENDGTIHSNIASYETLVTDNNDIPNKKYVDDIISGSTTLYDTLFELLDVTITGVPQDEILQYDSGFWINRTLDEANIVSTNGSTLNPGANITYNGGEPLGLPLIPTVDDAATSKAYVDDMFMPRISNIPVSKVGQLNYLPLNIKGSFDGAAVPDEHGVFVAVQERDGSIVGIRVGHNGNLIKFFYFFSLTGDITNLTQTDTEYRPPFLASDEFVTSIAGIASNNKGFYVLIDNTSGNPIKKYWIFNNGTMDATKHTFRDVSSIPTLTTNLTASLEHVSEFDIWIVSTFNDFYVYDDSFTLLQTIQHLDTTNPAHITFIDHPTHGPEVAHTLGFRSGANLQYYINGNNIRIGLKLGIFINYNNQGAIVRGINSLYDYNVISDSFSQVHLFPYIIDPSVSDDSNYPATGDMYNYFRDKWVNISPTLIVTGSPTLDGTLYNVHTFNQTKTFNDLVDFGGKASTWTEFQYAQLTDDASILGKSLRESLFLSDDTLYTQAVSKFVTETGLSTKNAYSQLVDDTSTYSLLDGTISLLPPVSSIEITDPIIEDLPNLSSIITDNGILQTKHFNPTTLENTIFDGSSGTVQASIVLNTLPANYDSQIKTILETLDPSLVTLPYEYNLKHLVDDLFIVVYTAYDSGINTAIFGGATINLLGVTFASVSPLIDLGSRPSTISAPIIKKNGTGIFNDTVNDIIYVIIPSWIHSVVGSNNSSTHVIKIDSNTGLVLDKNDNVFSSISLHYSASGIHPRYGPYVTDSFIFFNSRTKIIYQESLLGTISARMTDSFELFLSGDPTQTLNILTIQPPLGFNLYFDTFPVFLNGTSYIIQTGSLDIESIYPNPENQTFYVYVEVVLDQAKITILDVDHPESHSLIKIGTIITGPIGILTVDIEKVSRFDGNHSSELSQPFNIPIAGSDGKIDASWIDGVSITGAIITYTSALIPTGYLECNGAAISRTTYAELFAIIGTTFGIGDGSTTFNLPDLRGEFIRGWDNARGIDSGRVFGSSQDDEFESHSHTYHSGLGTGSHSVGDGDGNAANFTHSTNLTGGAETRPRNIALTYCIKY